MKRLPWFYLSFFSGALVRRAIAYAAVVYGFERLPGTNWSGVFYLALLVPYLLFSAAAGVLVDAVPKQRVLRWGTVVAAGAMALLSLAELQQWLGAGAAHAWLMTALIFIYGGAYAVVYPAFIASVPEIAEETQVSRTTILVNVLALVALAYASLCVGFLREALSWPGLFLAFALLAFVSFAGTSSVPLRSPPARDSKRATSGLSELWRIGTRDPLLPGLLLLAVVFSATIVGPLEVLLPQYAEGPLAFSPVKAGEFIAVGGTGLVLGSLFALKLIATRRVGAWLCGAAALGGALIVAMTYTPAWAAFPLFFASGLMGGIFSSLSLVATQQQAAAELRGRVMGVFALIFGGVPGLGGVAAGALAAHVGSAAALRAFFGGAVVLFLLQYALLRSLRAPRAAPIS